MEELVQEESIGRLTGPAEIERVVDSETTRLLRCTAVVLDRDTRMSVDGLYGASAPTPDSTVSPIPVGRKDSGQVIGTASVVWQGHRLIASLVLVYDCPERLLLQTGERMYAEAVFCDSPSGRVLVKLDLTEARPADERVTHLVVFPEV